MNTYYQSNNNQQYRSNQQSHSPALTKPNVNFYNSDGKLDPELYNEKAEKVANMLADSRGMVNSHTQLRRFYDEIVSLFSSVDGTSDPDKETLELLPLIKMMNAKVQYARGRKKVDQNFCNFIKYSIEQVNSYQSFKYFKTFFEAMMGFYKATQKGNK